MGSLIFNFVDQMYHWLPKLGRGDAPGIESKTSTRIHWAAVALSYLVAMLTSALALAAALPTYTIGPITNISSACSGQNAEVEQAVDPNLPNYVYEEWMGCKGIAFAVSMDGGVTFSEPHQLSELELRRHRGGGSASRLLPGSGEPLLKLWKFIHLLSLDVQ
jgi:hypothetical protein